MKKTLNQRLPNHMGKQTPAQSEGRTCTVIFTSYLTVVNHNLEEGVHEEDAVRQDTAAVQQHGLQQQETKPVIRPSLSIRCFDKHFPRTSPFWSQCQGKKVSDIKPSIKSRLEIHTHRFELRFVSSP